MYLDLCRKILFIMKLVIPEQEEYYEYFSPFVHVGMLYARAWLRLG